MFLILVVIVGVAYAAKNGWLSSLEKSINDQISKAKDHNDSAF